jgi:hypothetical protein
MKKILALSLLLLAFVVSCSKGDKVEPEMNLAEPQQEEPIGDLRQCAAHDVLQQQLAADPNLARQHEQIEAFIAEYLKTAQPRSGSLVTIPVVFNVLYKTAAQNVSNAQLQSQIDVLNEDFGATNSDYNSTPSLFQGVRSGDIGVAFSWNGTVNRKSTNKTSWQANDSMKKASQGGINPTNPTQVLNIWVCNLSGGILGYAQFPGGPSSTDGVVLDDNATGRTGTAASPFNKGRTATHEVGHWLNLRHIWGDATCGSDLVSDTPTHNTSNGGCPSYPHYSTCSGAPIEMTMNYMDYTYDACMYMFTQGQEARMQAVFAPGGPRASFVQ